MKDKTYIHYGHSEFDYDKFDTIKNSKFKSKPSSGLWASEIGDEFGWKDWCVRENFRTCNEDNSFKFKLKEETKILYINNKEDLDCLPKLKSDFDIPHMWTLLDFEKLIECGYDAIKYNLSNDSRLYFALYEWDCDSILIMNKNCIKLIK